MRAGDVLHRFLFEDTGIRGELVHLDTSFRAALDRYDYPQPIAVLLGEALAAAALLSATIKFEGSLTLQAQGEGPVRMLVVQCDHQRHLRGLVRWDGELPGAGAALNELFGAGRLVITIDPGRGKKRYQGVVALEEESLAVALESYFSRSEQLDTRLWLAASGERAAGMLLQRLPDAPEGDEIWERLGILGATVTAEELLDLPSEELLRRLYHEEEVRLFESEPVSFRCSCSREGIETMLRSLGEGEVKGILAERGEVKVACEFCAQRYHFDAVDIERLFAADAVQPRVPATKH